MTIGVSAQDQLAAASIALFGIATTFAADVEAVALRAGYEIVAAIDNVGGQPGVLHSRIYGVSNLPDLSDVPCYFPMVTPRHRRRAMAEATALRLAIGHVLADPGVSLDQVEWSGGATFVNTGVVLGAATSVGKSVVLNRSASIGHHGTLEDFCSIGPGATLGGHVWVGDSAFIGVGATILPEVRIGEGAFVGAGAVVIHDVEPGVTVVGNPARPIRSSQRQSSQ